MTQQLIPFRPPRPNLIIEAGAGTGKTTEIVKEVVTLLLDHPDLKPDRLVMITFTEKAAAEIGERVRDAITDLYTSLERGYGRWPSDAAIPIIEIPENKIARAKEACARHLRHLDRIQSQTIHSFCQGLLRKFPFEAGVDANFRLIEGYERSRFLQEVWSRWVEEETVTHPTEETLEDWEKSLEHYTGLDRVRDAIFELLEKRVLVTDSTYSLGDFADADETVRLGISVAKRLNSIQIESIVDDAGRAAIQYLHHTVPPLSQSIAEWREYFAPIAQALRDADFRHISKDGKDALRELREDGKFASVYDLLIRHEVAASLRRLTCRFITFLDREKHKQGVLDFDDLLLRAADLLDNDAGADAIRASVDYIFVDEFQDTDRVQARIVNRLARNRAGEVVHGRLVLVGDPKQSIYAFRHADPETYRDTIQDLGAAGAVKKTLTRQYRSDPALVDSLNAMFASLFTTASDPNVYRPTYHELQAARDHNGDESPRLLFLRSAAKQGEDEVVAAAHEGRAIASWIDTQVRAGRRYSDFAILLRKNVNIQAFLEGLDRRGIRYVIPPIGALLETRPVVDLLASLRAIAAPWDLGACVSAARTPYFALDDNEIVAGVLGEEAPGWQSFRETLKTLRIFAERAAVAEVIDHLIAETDLELIYGIARGGDEWWRFVERLRELADNFDRSVGGSVGQFVDELLRRRDSAEETQPTPIDDGRDAVRIMTVHGSKGLEFPIVILPELGARTKEDTLSVFTVEDPHRLVFTGTVSTLASRYLGLAEVSGERKSAETDRLFYVAVTRAKERVVFVSSPDRWNKHSFWKRVANLFGWEKGFNLWSTEPGTSIHETVVGGRLVPMAFVTPDPTDLDLEPSRFIGTIDGRQLAAAPRADEEPQPSAPEPLDRAEIFRRAAAGKNRVAGILLHRVLELWEGDSESVENVLTSAARELAADPRSLDMARKRLETVRRSATFRRILDAETHGRELTIYYQDPGGTAVEARIDRLIEENGQLVVVDFKSGEASTSRSTDDQQQVQQYCSAIELLTGRTCQGLLWYIDIDADSSVAVGAPAASPAVPPAARRLVDPA